VEAAVFPTAGGERHEFQPTFHDERDRSATLFDLRYLIGGLFALYGVVLVIAGFFVSEAKTNGIDINLWMGLGMLLFGICFLLRALVRPPEAEGLPAPAPAEQAGDERRGLGAGADFGSDLGVGREAGPRGQHRQRRPRWR
jgi:hypothetical protein